jgi:hypothetical protein
VYIINLFILIGPNGIFSCINHRQNGIHLFVQTLQTDHILGRFAQTVYANSNLVDFVHERAQERNSEMFEIENTFIL